MRKLGLKLRERSFIRYCFRKGDKQWVRVCGQYLLDSDTILSHPKPFQFRIDILNDLLNHVFGTTSCKLQLINVSSERKGTEKVHLNRELGKIAAIHRNRPPLIARGYFTEAARSIRRDPVGCDKSQNFVSDAF